MAPWQHRVGNFSNSLKPSRCCGVVSSTQSQLTNFSEQYIRNRVVKSPKLVKQNSYTTLIRPFFPLPNIKEEKRFGYARLSSEHFVSITTVNLTTKSFFLLHLCRMSILYYWSFSLTAG